MDESEGREVWFLNRDLLVVRPNEPYIEWARTVYDAEPITDEEARDWVDAFLLPECDTQEEALDWIAENCDVIFELMLADWVVEPEAWPEDRGRARQRSPGRWSISSAVTGWCISSRMRTTGIKTISTSKNVPRSTTTIPTRSNSSCSWSI